MGFNFSRLTTLVNRLERETRGCSILVKFNVFLILRDFSEGRYLKVYKKGRKLVKKGEDLGFYYLAEAQFLRGKNKIAYSLLSRALLAYPNKPDLVYLAANIHKELGDVSEAWNKLESLSKTSKRHKTWIVMSNMVRDTYDYNRLCALHKHAILCGLAPKNDETISKYLTIAALRARLYGEAKKLALDTMLSGSSTKTVKPRSVFTADRASRALRDLKSALGRSQIEMFLVSGTLLGCIREGKILGHDKDIDVGVSSSVCVTSLKNAIQFEGMFYIQPVRSPHVLRIRHLNGVPVDIFYHYSEGESIWHGGVKVNWFNKKFTLIEYPFLGGKYLIPKNYELYLTENYGEWKVAAKSFDSAIDTPNARLANRDEMIVHLINQLGKKPTAEKTKQYLDLLNEYGYPHYNIEKIARKLGYV